MGTKKSVETATHCLSKKLAAESTHLLLDISVGPSAKVRHMREALHLRKLFEYVGDRLGLHIEVIITNDRQPIRGISPVLEARDVMSVLRNEPDAPMDKGAGVDLLKKLAEPVKEG